LLPLLEGSKWGREMVAIPSDEGTLGQVSWSGDREHIEEHWHPAEQAERASGLAEQCSEAGLLEVMVAGQGVGQPTVGHHDEGDAVG
jgi:hypothetical protein